MENNLPQLRISIDQLPNVIEKTLTNIKDVDHKIIDAISKANDAKKLADIASRKKAGWFSGKIDAIEALQVAAISQADALSDSIVASKELFENQKKMSKAICYLFELGIVNMAANRTVVRELELKLQNASKKELSDLARQEITNVLLQLRAQEDMLYKLENHDIILREHKNHIDEALSEISSFEERCKAVLDRTETLQRDVETKENELSDQFFKEKRNIQAEVDRLRIALRDEITRLSDQLFVSIENKFTSALQEIETRLSLLEQYHQEELNKTTFFDTKLYKLIVGIISLSALIFSLIDLL